MQQYNVVHIILTCKGVSQIRYRGGSICPWGHDHAQDRKRLLGRLQVEADEGKTMHASLPMLQADYDSVRRSRWYGGNPADSRRSLYLEAASLRRPDSQIQYKVKSGWH